jgi:DNA-binding transcriptional LysR family regulator
MDLNELAVFARVVQAGSFRAAAAALGMPKSTVSRKVADLEERLGTRLLTRTTRTLSLTEAGRLLHDHAVRIVTEAENAERAVASLTETPRGVLRVTTGVNAGFLGPIVRDYLERYPEVRLELYCTGRTVDLVEERFDLGVRFSRLHDSTLIARSLGRIRWLLVATPGYLKKRGRPRAPGDLQRHAFLGFGVGIDRVTLRLEQDGERVELALSPRLVVSDGEILREAALGGLGVALVAAHECVDDLRARRLEQVLRDWEAPSTPVHVVYPSTRLLTPTVKTFIDHLQARMTPPPWELGPLP